MHTLARLGLSLIFIITISWLLIIAFFYFFQEKLVFFPSRDMALTPADIGLPYRDVYFHSNDGIKLHGWYVDAEQPRAHVLFLHGNAGNISHRLDTLKLLHELQLSVFIIDYRGYGQSDGKPTETGTYADAMAAWDHLLAEGIAAEDIVIMGRSLGGAVAAWLATEVTPGALVLESTFTSLADMGQHHYGFLPIKYIAQIHYNSQQRLAGLRAPLLLIHSPDDEIVPYALGQQLYDAANTEKRFVTIAGGHNDGFMLSRDKYTAALADFLHKQLQ